MKFFIVFIFLNFFALFSFASNFYGKGLNGKLIQVEGYIHDAPKYHSNHGGKYQSYTFRLNAGSDQRHGDEFIVVTFYTVKWGQKVGSFNGSRGNKISLTGKYREFKGPRKSGIIGSIAVNDKSHKEVVGR